MAEEVIPPEQPAPKAKPKAPHFNMLEFVEVWQASDDLYDVCRHFGYNKPSSASWRAKRLRVLGIPLKRMPRGRKPVMAIARAIARKYHPPRKYTKAIRNRRIKKWVDIEVQGKKLPRRVYTGKRPGRKRRPRPKPNEGADPLRLGE